AALAAADQVIEHGLRARRLQLLRVPFAKLRPLCGVVLVPLPQLARRRDLFGPRVQMRIGLRETAWPEPVNEHAVAVGWRVRLVGSLGRNHRYSSTGSVERPCWRGL